MSVERFPTAADIEPPGQQKVRVVQKCDYNQADDEPMLDQRGNTIQDQDGRRLFSD